MVVYTLKHEPYCVQILEDDYLMHGGVPADRPQLVS